MEPTLCNGIMLSDGVIREAGTGKLSLIGCFTHWNADRFPFSVPPFFATVLLTNLRGEVDQLNLTVRIEDPQTGHVLTSVSTVARTEKKVMNPEEIHELPFPIPSFLMPKAGTFHVIMLVNNEVVGKRPFRVKSITAGALPE